MEGTGVKHRTEKVGSELVLLARQQQQQYRCFLEYILMVVGLIFFDV
jgi:hypothetical protein